MFEPFYRLECSRSRDTGGTGLGLTIARNIIEQHGGTITLRNVTEGGLEVLVRLPYRDTDTRSHAPQTRKGAATDRFSPLK